MCGSTGCISTCASSKTACVAWSSWVSVSTAPRSWSPSPTGTGSPPTAGRTCYGTSSAVACARRSSPSATGRSGSGPRYGMCGPRPASSATGCTRSPTPSTRSPPRCSRRPRRCWPRSATPRTATTLCAAAKRFDAEFGAKWPKAAAKIVDDAEQLLTFFDFPAEHWLHLKTSNPIESTFATVRLRTKVTKGPGSRAAGLAMAFKLIEAAQDRWRAVNGPAPRRPRPRRRHVPRRGC